MANRSYVIPTHVDYAVEILIRGEWHALPVIYSTYADAAAHPRLKRRPDSTRVTEKHVPEHIAVDIGVISFD